MQQLEAQEGRFAESLVALQFQKAAGAARTLWAYTALLSVQHLLLEELSESETLTKAACAQILESHSPVSAPGGTGLRHPSAHLGSPPASGRVWAVGRVQEVTSGSTWHCTAFTLFSIWEDEKHE